MAFNSLQFWFLFPFIFVLYWLIPAKYNSIRKVFLIIVSYLLYMNWKPAFAIVLMFVTLITFYGAKSIHPKSQSINRKRTVCLFSILGLLPLITFKYYNFINDTASGILSTIGLQIRLGGLNWAIPVGISFFTFQAVGYMLDVYHKRTEPENNLADYILFVSFFPQVTSGPIGKAEELLPQIKNSHSFDYKQGKLGLKLLLWGMFMKLVIADRLGIYVDTVYANYIHFNGTTCFVASLLYTIQIYCDFAGYSLMAIGIARTLGFNLTDNFRRPYLAVSITDFWKRWHISLTRWLTQQIYIPLGGSRCSKAKCYMNIIATFLVSGIWHGANWTFVLWGAIHGVLQIVEKSFGLQHYDGKNVIVKTLRICCTLLLVSSAWVFFRMPTIGDSFQILARMFTDFGIPAFSIIDTSVLLMLAIGLAILAFKELREEFFLNKAAFLNSRYLHFVFYILLFCLILSYGVLDGGQFIYANF